MHNRQQNNQQRFCFRARQELAKPEWRTKPAEQQIPVSDFSFQPVRIFSANFQIEKFWFDDRVPSWVNFRLPISDRVKPEDNFVLRR